MGNILLWNVSLVIMMDVILWLQVVPNVLVQSLFFEASTLGATL
ncbi:hypothetical protein BCM20_000268 [Clostridium beijerinckii]|nr:hypothetical protein [Clostridium beijerinckii]NYC00313.1 hypothetical protein [Clostridium beijerinckii]